MFHCIESNNMRSVSQGVAYVSTADYKEQNCSYKNSWCNLFGIIMFLMCCVSYKSDVMVYAIMCISYAVKGCLIGVAF